MPNESQSLCVSCENNFPGYTLCAVGKITPLWDCGEYIEDEYVKLRSENARLRDELATWQAQAVDHSNTCAEMTTRVLELEAELSALRSHYLEFVTKHGITLEDGDPSKPGTFGFMKAELAALKEKLEKAPEVALHRPTLPQQEGMTGRGLFHDFGFPMISYDELGIYYGQTKRVKIVRCEE